MQHDRLIGIVQDRAQRVRGALPPDVRQLAAAGSAGPGDS